MDKKDAGGSAEDLVFGYADATAANFRTLVLFLSKDSAYANVGLARVRELDRSLRLRRILCATRKNQLLGLVLWTTMSDEVARRAINQGRLPAVAEVTHTGDALLLTGIAAAGQGILSALARRVFSIHLGQLVLYERHQVRGQPGSVFTWVDKKGVRLGQSLD